MDKETLIENIIESMNSTEDDNALLNAAIQTAQKRLSKIEQGTVQTIPGEIALTTVRNIITARN